MTMALVSFKEPSDRKALAEVAYVVRAIRIVRVGRIVGIVHGGRVVRVILAAAVPVIFDEAHGKNAFEAARIIRGLDRADAPKVPIIALSANAFEEDITMAKDAGMNEHLAKPVDIGGMFSVMRRLTGGL